MLGHWFVPSSVMKPGDRPQFLKREPLMITAGLQLRTVFVLGFHIGNLIVLHACQRVRPLLLYESKQCLGSLIFGWHSTLHAGFDIDLIGFGCLHCLVLAVHPHGFLSDLLPI